MQQIQIKEKTRIQTTSMSSSSRSNNLCINMGEETNKGLLLNMLKYMIHLLADLYYHKINQHQQWDHWMYSGFARKWPGQQIWPAACRVKTEQLSSEKETHRHNFSDEENWCKWGLFDSLQVIVSRDEINSQSEGFIKMFSIVLAMLS